MKVKHKINQFKHIFSLNSVQFLELELVRGIHSSCWILVPNSHLPGTLQWPISAGVHGNLQLQKKRFK